MLMPKTAPLGRALTTAMKKAGSPGRDGQWTLEQALNAWECEWQGAGHCKRASQAEHRQYAHLDVELRALLLAECDSEPQAPALGCGFDEWLAFYFDPELTADKVNKGTGCDKANVLRGLREFNHAYFKSEAVETAAKRLPGYLYDLCTLPDCSMVPGPT